MYRGKNDDQVDALGLIGQLLDTIMHGDGLPKFAGDRQGRAVRSSVTLSFVPLIRSQQSACPPLFT
jgi:hypothetical protein